MMTFWQTPHAPQMLAWLAAVFEQPLDSILKSLATSIRLCASGMELWGHGDGANYGFLRQDSTLAIIMISDEDDCSTPNDELFDSSSPLYTGDLNLRCFAPGSVAPGATIR